MPKMFATTAADMAHDSEGMEHPMCVTISSS
jgi:hypothetical protein